MSAGGAAFARVHDRLEERTEDRGRDAVPVEPGSIKHRLPQLGIERRHRQRAFKQISVHVRKRIEIIVQIGLPFFFRRVEHFKQIGQPLAERRAVSRSALLDQVQECIPWEDAGVFREKAEDEPDHEALQCLAAVAGGQQCVVDRPHQLGRADIDRILLFEPRLLDAHDEREFVDVLGQIGEAEARDLALVQVLELEFLEVAEQQIAWERPISEGVKVPQRLFPRVRQAPARALVLDQ